VNKLLSKDAQTYLDNFEHCDPEGREMKELWNKASPDERNAIRQVLSDRTHARNADHAERILRDLPKKWRDVVIALVQYREGP
jgi:hypothetical protein